ncbi:hypothetical protein [Streptomyces bobili]|uniref:Uncharacterized protein n=1 Tax=Streptomyces bobili TaxID=67280 RepID=A0ABZ1R8Q5_9ACTN|nr:hypothetical protein [Streptomyces bobili]
MSDSGTTTADDAAWWRLWATRHRVAAAVLGGVIAAHVATIFGYWFPGVGLPRLDWNTANGWVYVPFGTPLEKFAVGGLFHYLDGIIFAVVFAVALHPVLPWRNTVLGNLAKGLVFGTLLAITSVAFVTPRIFGPARDTDPGILSLDLGWKYLLAVFVWHWVYGLHLALIYNPLPSRTTTAVALREAPALEIATSLSGAGSPNGPTRSRHRTPDRRSDLGRGLPQRADREDPPDSWDGHIQELVPQARCLREDHSSPVVRTQGPVAPPPLSTSANAVT